MPLEKSINWIVTHRSAAVNGGNKMETSIEEVQPRAKRISPAGKHYKKALSPDMWAKAEQFIQMIQNVKTYATTMNVQPEIDLKKLRESFVFVE